MAIPNLPSSYFPRLIPFSIKPPTTACWLFAIIATTFVGTTAFSLQRFSFKISSHLLPMTTKVYYAFKELFWDLSPNEIFKLLTTVSQTNRSSFSHLRFDDRCYTFEFVERVSKVDMEFENDKLYFSLSQDDTINGWKEIAAAAIQKYPTCNNITIGLSPTYKIASFLCVYELMRRKEQIQNFSEKKFRQETILILQKVAQQITFSPHSYYIPSEANLQQLLNPALRIVIYRP